MSAWTEREKERKQKVCQSAKRIFDWHQTFTSFFLTLRPLSTHLPSMLQQLLCHCFHMSGKVSNGDKKRTGKCVGRDLHAGDTFTSLSCCFPDKWHGDRSTQYKERSRRKDQEKKRIVLSLLLVTLDYGVSVLSISTFENGFLDQEKLLILFLHLFYFSLYFYIIFNSNYLFKLFSYLL